MKKTTIKKPKNNKMKEINSKNTSKLRRSYKKAQLIRLAISPHPQDSGLRIEPIR